MAFTIAIDGPAAAGKGTISRKVAAHFGFAHMDTGLLYRAVALSLIREGISPDNTRAAATAAKNLSATMLSDPALRDDEVANLASRVAAIAAVRQALIKYQRDFAHKPPDGAPGTDGRTAACDEFLEAWSELKSRVRIVCLLRPARPRHRAEPADT